MDQTSEPSTTTGGGGGGGCPVNKHGGGGGASAATAGEGGGWSSWFGGRGAAAPATSSSTAAPAPASAPNGGGCPVKHDGNGSGSGDGGTTTAMPFNMPPASIEEAASHPQLPCPDQRIPLSTRRVVSTIPRADELRNPIENRPAAGGGGGISAAEAGQGEGGEGKADKASTCAPHQPPEHSQWVYPSEQQFYNALRRKGWQPEESTIPDVVRIHNAVNERGWSDVRRWEALRGNDSPRLVRFMGRPKDLSPRAWFNSRVLWYTEPFDRHDWYVDGGGDGGGNGDSGAEQKKQEEPRRYVIDFYSGKQSGSSASDAAAAKNSSGPLPPRPPSMYIDVRPALDGPDEAIDRMKMFVKEAFPGLSAAFGMDDGSSGDSSAGGSGGSDSRSAGTSSSNANGDR